MKAMNFHRNVIWSTSVALLLWVLPAHATAPGWTPYSTVRQLVTTADGAINVMLLPMLSGCTSYGGYGGTFASVYPSHPAIKFIKADLLTAYATGTKVSLYLEDSTCRIREIRLGEP